MKRLNLESLTISPPEESKPFLEGRFQTIISRQQTIDFRQHRQYTLDNIETRFHIIQTIDFRQKRHQTSDFRQHRQQTEDNTDSRLPTKRTIYFRQNRQQTSDKTDNRLETTKTLDNRLQTIQTKDLRQYKQQTQTTQIIDFRQHRLLTSDNTDYRLQTTQGIDTLDITLISGHQTIDTINKTGVRQQAYQTHYIYQQHTYQTLVNRQQTLQTSRDKKHARHQTTEIQTTILDTKNQTTNVNWRLFGLEKNRIRFRLLSLISIEF